MDDFIYGSRAKIGLIYPAPGWTMEAEFNLMAPKGVATLATRIESGVIDVNTMNSISEKSIKAAKLLAEAPVDVIALGCTSASFVNGLEYERKLLHEMENETKVKCITTSLSIINALKTMGINKVSVATPYIDEVNEKAKSYIKESGIDIVNFKGLGLTRDSETNSIDLESIYRLGKSVNNDECEAVLLLCTGIRSVPIIEMLETDLNKPVITAIQATFWNCLRLCNVNEKIKGFGSLFSV